jgi:hypothetical protein
MPKSVEAEEVRISCPFADEVMDAAALLANIIDVKIRERCEEQKAHRDTAKSKGESHAKTE